MFALSSERVIVKTGGNCSQTLAMGIRASGQRGLRSWVADQRMVSPGILPLISFRCGSSSPNCSKTKQFLRERHWHQKTGGSSIYSSAASHKSYRVKLKENPFKYPQTQETAKWYTTWIVPKDFPPGMLWRPHQHFIEFPRVPWSRPHGWVREVCQAQKRNFAQTAVKALSCPTAKLGGTLVISELAA